MSPTPSSFFSLFFASTSGMIVFAVIILLIVAVVVLAVIVMKMHRRLGTFLVTIDSRHIGDSLNHLKKETEELARSRTETEAYLEDVEKRLRRSIQSVHTLRFNPFKGTGGGGNQSFATVFLNEDGDGVILSSLYSREHVSVFSKPVTLHKSDFELSEEEAAALESAKKRMI